MKGLIRTSPANFFNLKGLNFSDFINKQNQVWDIIINLADYLEKIIIRRQLSKNIQLHSSTAILGNKIRIDADVIISPFSFLDASKGPIWIGKGAKILSGTRIRGPALIGKNCQVNGEIKNSLILDEAHSDHLSNYVGDSIVGRNCRLGCGTILSNRRFDRKTIRIKIKKQNISTGTDRLGAILGDKVKTGCHSLLGPGALIGPDSWIGQQVIVKNEYIEKGRLLVLKQSIRVNKIKL
ncbi:MAG: glucose-1-phosphate thymidylyltransferase [Candidatus Kerfeldbacteria bacterium CG08_land_8_20_14_0_20_40_16]|uniref:Glucose-1-phosphate thymidylyltransferase n=1 Tax=Candidatus Kerfeldbacteria bacterium CG08_land_8_20_14_0_20_40_16 TaxID=2014244 RepID=A0A2H0YVG2_9BACT|nr:MAG: glucose-1-phosphate thymidylyltransferase [Candidatus Kerfeldbacteria bacterium CG08_land_8_20_14_0_20_40_16]